MVAKAHSYNHFFRKLKARNGMKPLLLGLFCFTTILLRLQATTNHVVVSVLQILQNLLRTPFGNILQALPNYFSDNSKESCHQNRI